MICPIPDCTAHFACSLRNKGVQLSPKATPNRTTARKHVVRPMQQPSWENGIVTDRRPDGSRMPVLAPGTLRPLGVHEQASMRHRIDEGLRRLHNDPQVLSGVQKAS
jgi:hypothetical protein